MRCLLFALMVTLALGGQIVGNYNLNAKLLISSWSVRFGEIWRDRSGAGRLERIGDRVE